MSDQIDEVCLFVRCEKCDHIVSKVDLEKSLYVCRNCGCHMRISARKRIELIADVGSFQEFNAHLGFANPIDFPGYEEKYLVSQTKTKMNEAIVTGVATINGTKVVLGAMEGDFIMGSMGVTLGEKVCQMFEHGIERQCPVVVFTTSGGARMQEGIAALLQMSKTASVVGLMNENKIPFICVLCSPTTGGVTASFAMLGDIILAEPDALIGFAGPRVIKQTIKQDLPTGFQKSEHLLRCGFIDRIVKRYELKHVLSFLVDMHECTQAKKSDFARVCHVETNEDAAV